MLVSFTLISSNRKTGPIPNSMTEQKSCPTICPYKESKSCYPYYSPLGFMWESLENNGYYNSLTKKKCIQPITWDVFCDKVSRLPKGQIWRHNTAGDLPGEGNQIDLLKLQQLVNANKKARANGFTYTHKPVGNKGLALVNATAIYASNKSGFKINLSADSVREADRLIDLDIAPVVLVIPSDAPNKMKTPKGRHIIACPAEDDKNNMQCIRCGLCIKDRKVIVGFHSHGTKVKNVNRILKVLGGL